MNGSSNLMFGALLWAMGMAGVITITMQVSPQFFAREPKRLSLRTPLIVSILQSSLLLLVAVWSGVMLAPSVGLAAPALTALVLGGPLLPAIFPQLIPGLIGGALGGTLITVAPRFAPQRLKAASKDLKIPLASRMLYGGVTEELLMRWGFMTIVAWAIWRVAQQGIDSPADYVIWSAIALSGLFFGLGHLPLAARMTGGLTVGIVSFVVFVNAAFGFVAGYLFWKFGLETAIIAHATAHLLAYIIEPRPVINEGIPGTG